MIDTKEEDNKQEWKRNLYTQIIAAYTGDSQEQSKAYEEIEYYYRCCAPASLFKYYSDEPKKLQAVKANKLWYSMPCNFNDVFDCDISINQEELFNCVLRRFPNNRRIMPGSIEWNQIRRTINEQAQLMRATFDEARSNIGVSCLTETCKSLLMWAHYANCHRGMCVEYPLAEIEHQLGYLPIPVIYSESRVSFRLPNSQTIEKDALKLVVQSLTSKSPEWSYEREWRMLRDDVSCGEQWNKKEQGALLKMIRPCSIILGCAAKPDFEEEVKTYCADSRINLYKMKRNPTQYRLDKTTIFEFGD